MSSISSRQNCNDEEQVLNEGRTFIPRTALYSMRMRIKPLLEEFGRMLK